MILNYYQILEIPHAAQADEIKKAYRKQAFKWHPDHNNGSKESNERFKKIAQAYEVLSNPLKRRLYDQDLGMGKEGATHTRQEDTVDTDQAASIFMQEMMQFAAELTFKNTHWKDIAEELEKKGCPSDIAKMIAKEVEGHRKKTIRNEAKSLLLRGMGLLIIGMGVTWFSYSSASAGGTYFAAWGAILYGIFYICKGGYFYITGRVPVPIAAMSPKEKKKDSRNKWLVGLLVVLVLILVGAAIGSSSSSSQATSDSSTSTSSDTYTPNDSVKIGDYTCSSTVATQADNLAPASTEQDWINSESTKLSSEKDTLDSEEVVVNSSYVNDYSPQYKINEYNKEVDKYNTDKDQYNSEVDAYNTRRNKYLAAVNTLTSYLSSNCTK